MLLLPLDCDCAVSIEDGYGPVEDGTPLYALRMPAVSVLSTESIVSPSTVTPYCVAIWGGDWPGFWKPPSG